MSDKHKPVASSVYPHGTAVVKCSCGKKFYDASLPKAEERHSSHAQDSDRCPTPSKRRYATRDDADHGILGCWQAGRPVKLRAYECVCGAWHITSRKGQVLGETIRVRRHVTAKAPRRS